MSYEGYTEVLCSNGHYTTIDCHDSLERCPWCKSLPKMTREVDQTNGAMENYPITMSSFHALKVKEPLKTQTCDLGHKHIIKQQTYYFPVCSSETGWMLVTPNDYEERLNVYF